MSASWTNFIQNFKNNWKAIIWGLVPIVLIVLIFALPLKVVPVQVKENYWTTEMKNEPYKAQESYQENEAYLTTEMRTETIFDSYVNYGWSYNFGVPKPGTTVYVSMQGTPYYSQPYYFIYSDNVTNPYWPYYYSRWDGWDGREKVTIRVNYPEDVTRYRPVTKTREVTRYREVPVQMQKEKLVTQYVRMSVWQYLFLDQTIKR